MFPATTKVLKYKAYLRRKEFRRAKDEFTEAAKKRNQMKAVRLHSVEELLANFIIFQSNHLLIRAERWTWISLLNHLETEKTKTENTNILEKELGTGEKHLGEIEKFLEEEGAKIDELARKSVLLQTEQMGEPSKESQAQFNSLLDHAKSIKV